jgi:exosortase
VGGLIYLPTFLSVLWDKTSGGSSTIVLNVGFLYMGIARLWAHRKELKATKVLMDDRFIGHALVLTGALWIPFAFHSISLQAGLWMITLIGMAWSSFTPTVFSRFPLAIVLILMGFYPDWVWLSSQVFQAFTGPYQLENAMAWISTALLNVVGQTAEVQARFINLPSGSVEVAPGCSGYDMAFVLAVASILWGLLTNQTWSRIVLVTVAGIVIALVSNIPRILLMTFAAIYWGEESFDFWHGFWGGQIFSAIMFTAYYYAAVGLFETHTSRSKAGY